MVDNIKLYFRLLISYCKMDLVWAARDTRVMLLQVFTDIIASCSSVIGMYFLSIRFDGSGDMSRAELLFMLGYALLVSGVFALMFYNNNTGAMSRIIGRGQLDHVLIQPVPLSIHFLTSGVAPISGSGPFLCGLALTIYACRGLSISFHPLWLLLLVLLLVCSTAIMTSWMLAFSCTAFWAPYAAEEIATDAIDLFESLAAYPLGGFPFAAQLVLCSLLPIGTMAWFPARILLDKANTLGTLRR